MKTLSEFLDDTRRSGRVWVAKRLSGNDTGLTGGHQGGLYLPEAFFRKVFPSIITRKVLNPKAELAEVEFPQSGFVAKTVVATYYNNKHAGGEGERGTRDEFRLTSWGGEGCPLMMDGNTGAAMIFAIGKERGEVWIAENPDEESEMEAWLGQPVEPGRTILSWEGMPESQAPEDLLGLIPPDWFKRFPQGKEVFEFVEKHLPFPMPMTDPDALLEARRALEFEVFLEVERRHVLPQAKKGFASVEDFLALAGEVTNRRKARSGKSLEYGLASILHYAGVHFDAQARTEAKSVPDFLLPGGKEYHDAAFPAERLTMLASKTTCKDRWRQVTVEADRIPLKHLFTLQEGVSVDQLREMEKAKVVLVVPEALHRAYPKEWREKLLSLADFIALAKKRQGE